MGECTDQQPAQLQSIPWDPWSKMGERSGKGIWSYDDERNLSAAFGLPSRTLDWMRHFVEHIPGPTSRPETMAPPLQDLRRIALGLSLVAKETLYRSPAFHAAKSGDFPALLSSALLSAADLAGVSKGEVRPYSPPRNKESVVFFADPKPIVAADPEPAAVAAERAVESAPESGREEEVVSDAAGSVEDKVKVAVAREQEEGFGVTSVVQGGQSEGDGGVNVAPLKRRKPRERRVPSTPFTRALG